MAAGAPPVVCAVAGHRLREIHPEPQSLAHDVALGQVLERCVHADAGAFNSGLGGQVGQALERVDELRRQSG